MLRERGEEKGTKVVRGGSDDAGISPPSASALFPPFLAQCSCGILKYIHIAQVYHTEKTNTLFLKNVLTITRNFPIYYYYYILTICILDIQCKKAYFCRLNASIW